MDKDTVKGKAKDIAGRIQRQAGEWTGDSETEAKGAAKQAEGKVQKTWGKMKDSARDIQEHAEEPDRDTTDADDEISSDRSTPKRETEMPIKRRDDKAA